MTPCTPGCYTTSFFWTRLFDRLNLGIQHCRLAALLAEESGRGEVASQRTKQQWRLCIAAVHAESSLSAGIVVILVINVPLYTG